MSQLTIYLYIFAAASFFSCFMWILGYKAGHKDGREGVGHE